MLDVVLLKCLPQRATNELDESQRETRKFNLCYFYIHVPLIHLFICSFTGSVVLCLFVQPHAPMAVQPLTNWNSGLFSCCDDTKSCKIPRHRSHID